MSRRKLSDDEVQAALTTLPSWQLRAGKLYRKLEFPSFVEAFAFMTGLGLAAQASDHHPELHNVYNRVELELCTHDVAGITELDLALARIADKLALGLQR